MAKLCKDEREYHTLESPKQFATKGAFKEAVQFGIHWKCARCGLGSRSAVDNGHPAPSWVWEPGASAVFTVPTFKWYARITLNVAGNAFVVE